VALTMTTYRNAEPNQGSFRRFAAYVLLGIALTSGGLVAASASFVGAEAPVTVGAPPAPAAPAGAVSGGDIPRVAPVGPNADLRLTLEELDLLAHIINGESRGEPFLGQVAVGAVVLNRVRAGGEYGGTVAEVIYRQGQFEPVRNGQINLNPTASCIMAAKAAAQGQDPTDGALYFWQPDLTYASYLWSRPLKVEIGCHRFTE
jgi:hypothetical protein